MRGALLGSIVGRESRVCACGTMVEHLVIRYAVRRVAGGMARGTVYEPRAHRAPCGRPCGRSLPPGESPAVERHHLEGCQLCAVEKLPEPETCPTCNLWMKGAHSCPESYVCRECGDETRASVANPVTRASMEAERVCALCFFWADKVATRDAACYVRSGGRHFVLSDDGDRVPLAALGSNGRTVVITYPDGRRVTCSNVWYQGRIPEHFRGRLPDNARLEWVDEKGAARG